MSDGLVRTRRNSLRYDGYDYAKAGWYFVTTCTRDRRPLLGVIDDGLMVPNDIGDMVNAVWHQLPAVFSSVMLDTFQLMPDHAHGIVVLGTDPSIIAEHSLGDIVRYFKGRTTTRYFTEARRGVWPRVDGQVWQRGYHDRIIRSERELQQIRAYIEGNPGRWWMRRQG